MVDPARLSDDLGGAAGFSVLADTVRDADMGLLVDVVPNHMAADAANPWWWDVLENGERSRYASWFDVDWSSMLDAGLRGRVLLPVLGEDLETVVQRGELRLERRGDGPVVARYHDMSWPIAPASLPDVPIEAVNASPTVLLGVLDTQAYRLVEWRAGMPMVNYRRFFDITSLVALRAEDPDVFVATHALVLDLVRRGDVDGLRIDHVDGLRLPRDYLERLRAAAGDDAWIVVEKILGDGEPLASDWPVQGTTGYDFTALSTRVQTDPRGEAPLSERLRDMGGTPDFAAAVREAKLQVMEQTLAADVSRLVVLLRRVLRRREPEVARSDEELRRAVLEMVAAVPVYRTYADLDDVESLGDGDAAELVLRFQQLCAAVAAKGVEDTAFYRVVTLASLDEVGGGPLPFSASVADLHAHNAAIQRRWPETLLATTTHDTKRSGDVRARLALLSEMPQRWARTVLAWRDRNAGRWRGAEPDGVMELLLYQTLVGAWPIERARMLAYMDKASREAKLRTSWIDPSPEYDRALRGFVDAVYDDQAFMAEVAAVVAPLVTPGRVNALATALLLLTSPGVPDVYQGCEVWTLSLVDPDNRRPVDYEQRRALLRRSREVTAAVAWREEAESGLPKLLLTRRALRLRARRSELFGRDGAYRPLEVAGERAAHVIAFGRGVAPGAVTVVPRLVLGVGGDWGDTRVSLPDGAWFDQLGGRRVAGDVPVAELLGDFPVALLAREPFEEG